MREEALVVLEVAYKSYCIGVSCIRIRTVSRLKACIVM